MLEKHNRPAETNSEGEKKSYSTQMNGHYYHGRGSLCNKSTIRVEPHKFYLQTRYAIRTFAQGGG